MREFPKLHIDLPINAVLGELICALAQRSNVVLEAPPGAGKTTVVPLALLEQEWLAGQKIIIMQPRRIAARSSAIRMAQILGEQVGQTVGYRVRLDSKVSALTRIEVVTEGVLTRMLLDDPSLAGIGLLIFDEFHERHLESDLGLALSLQGRALFREDDIPLKLLLMSATLDGQRLASFLNDAPLIRSEGKMFPVAVHYANLNRSNVSIVEKTTHAVLSALRSHQGSVLVFLPGQGEIARVQAAISEQLQNGLKAQVEIVPLYGALSWEEQQRAILPAAQGKRKVVLSTDIAETSLTIEGVCVVVDSGLKRVAEFDPNNGISRLHTRKISVASSVQRMGRAGRLQEGACYRLWTEAEQRQLQPHDMPEMLFSDLCPFALQLLSWGVSNPAELNWLDVPPNGPYRQAVDLLLLLGALDKSGEHNVLKLNKHGEHMARLPVHPRLAHMMIYAQRYGLAEEASFVAALMSERDPFRQQGVDLALRILALKGDVRCDAKQQSWKKRVLKQASRYRQHVAEISSDMQSSVCAEDALGFLLALAYPDRIAKKRPDKGNAEGGGVETNWQLSGGSGVSLAVEDRLAEENWLAVADSGGLASWQNNLSRQQHKIFLAAVINPALFDDVLAYLVTEREIVEWDDRAERFIAEAQQQVGELQVSRKPLNQIPFAAKQDALIAVIRKRGLEILPWNDQLRQWQARVNLLYAVDQEQPWPDLKDVTLLASLGQWLGPYLDSVNTLKDIDKLDLTSIFQGMLSWPMQQRLEELAPSIISVPSGSNVRIDYRQDPPVLSVKLQEMFGCLETPIIANGKVKLLLYLLSPARRPIQITQDLAGFWKNSYEQVKKDMKGRYPKHPWPDDPINAIATAKTKRKS